MKGSDSLYTCCRGEKREKERFDSTALFSFSNEGPDRGEDRSKCASMLCGRRDESKKGKAPLDNQSLKKKVTGFRSLRIHRADRRRRK